MPVLLLVICILFILTLCAWNLYKIFKFVDKRKQIDSFFFNDIKEALENKNTEGDKRKNS